MIDLTPEDIAKMDQVSGLSAQQIEQMDQITGLADKPKEEGMGKKIVRGVAEIAPVAGGILGGIGGTVAGAAAGGIPTLGLGAVPGGMVVGAAGTAVGTGAGGAIKNALYTLAGEPMNSQQMVNEAITKPAQAGLTDLATAGLLHGAGKALGPVSKALTKSIPERIMGNVFKEPLKETRAAISTSLKDSKELSNLGIEALNKGEWGSAEKIWQKAAGNIEIAESKLQDVLTKEHADKFVDIEKIKDAAMPYIKKLRQAGNVADSDAIVTRIKNIEAENGNQIPVAVANEIKRTLYTEARNGYGKVASETIEGVKSIAKGLKTQIEDVTNGAVKPLNEELSYSGRVLDAMTDRIARVGRNELISLKNAGLIGAGLATAPVSHGLSLLPAVGTTLAGTTLGQTAVAQALKNAPQIVGKAKPFLDIARRTAQGLVINR